MNPCRRLLYFIISITYVGYTHNCRDRAQEYAITAEVDSTLLGNCTLRDAEFDQMLAVSVNISA